MTKFTGVPALRPAARPANPVRMVGGKLRRPQSGIDHLLFGVAPFVAPGANVYRRIYVE